MTVRPLQPSTSKAVQTVIVPTQGFVNPFSKFYERSPPKRATQTTRKDPRGIATPMEVTENGLLGYNRRCHTTPEPGARPGSRKTQAEGVPAPRVMTVRPLYPSTSIAVQTVIVPSQGFVNPFTQFYERPQPKRATRTTRKNHVEQKVAPPQRKPVVRSTMHRVEFANKPMVVRE